MPLEIISTTQVWREKVDKCHHFGAKLTFDFRADHRGLFSIAIGSSFIFFAPKAHTARDRHCRFEQPPDFQSKMMFASRSNKFLAPKLNTSPFWSRELFLNVRVNNFAFWHRGSIKFSRAVQCERSNCKSPLVVCAKSFLAPKMLHNQYLDQTCILIERPPGAVRFQMILRWRKWYRLRLAQLLGVICVRSDIVHVLLACFYSIKIN